MQYTDNKKFNLPEYTDTIDIVDLNKNFAKIDENLTDIEIDLEQKSPVDHIHSYMDLSEKPCYEIDDKVAVYNGDISFVEQNDGSYKFSTEITSDFNHGSSIPRIVLTDGAEIITSYDGDLMVWGEYPFSHAGDNYTVQFQHSTSTITKTDQDGNATTETVEEVFLIVTSELGQNILGCTVYADYYSIKKLDEKFLPDHVSANAIIEQNKGLEQKFWRGTAGELPGKEDRSEDTMYIVIGNDEDDSVFVLGDMLAEVYDPQGKKQDVFAYVDNAIEAIPTPQADWNQNDATQPDYVKNRTHYATESREVWKFWDTPIDDIRVYYVYDGDGNGVEWSTGVFSEDGVFADPPAPGKYIIEWDGVEYVADENLSFNVGQNTIRFITRDYAYWTDFVVLYEDENGDSVPDDGEHTVTIYEVIEDVVPLDEKYLPESVKAIPDWNQSDETAPDYVKNRTHWVESEAYWTPIDSTGATLIGETITVAGANSRNSFPGTYTLSDCNKYRVTLDGAEYVVEAEYDSNNEAYGIYIEPLIIGFTESALYMHRDDTNGSTDMSVKIESYIEAVCHTIDAKFLPDTLATKADIEAAIGAAIGGSY